MGPWWTGILPGYVILYQLWTHKSPWLHSINLYFLILIVKSSSVFFKCFFTLYLNSYIIDYCFPLTTKMWRDGREEIILSLTYWGSLQHIILGNIGNASFHIAKAGAHLSVIRSSTDWTIATVVGFVAWRSVQTFHGPMEMNPADFWWSPGFLSLLPSWYFWFRGKQQDGH